MFFSVKQSLKIDGKVYTPCVCYRVTETLKLTINKLVAEGKAVLYDRQVFFQNGKVLPSLEEIEAKEKAEKKAKKEAEKKAKKEAEESEGF